MKNSIYAAINSLSNYNHLIKENAVETIKYLQRVLNDEEMLLFQKKHNLTAKVFRGIGKYPLCPWFAFLSNDLCYTIQKGFYICVLMDIDLKFFYLTIQSGTEGKSRNEIRKNAELGKKIMGTESNFNLGGYSGRPFLYVIGSVYSKKYDISDFEISTLVDDIESLVIAFKDAFI